MGGISHISGPGNLIRNPLYPPKNEDPNKPDAGKAPHELSQAEKKQVAELKKIDAKVRAHEMAHLGASGGHATSGAKYEYTVGPDGKSYAVAGEVSIDTSPVRGDPHATMAKARTIQAAALAPADPSGADRAVAAAAAQMEAEAAQQLARKQFKESNGEAEASGETKGAVEVASAGAVSETGRTNPAQASESEESGGTHTGHKHDGPRFGIVLPEPSGGSLDITA